MQATSRVALSSFFLFCFSLFLTAYSARNRWFVELGFKAVAELLYPLQVVFRKSSQGVSGIWDGYIALIGVQEENQILRERLEALEAENSRLLEEESEVKRLRMLLNAAEEHQLQGIAANVIGYDPSNWIRAIIVDKGSTHGVETGLAVIDGDAIVGHVIATSLYSSKVLLLTDHASGIDSLVQNSRARGVVQGLGKEFCELRYVLQEDTVSVGDRIISSGMDGIFPKGLAVGVITEMPKKTEGIFQSIRVRPSAKLARLETVLIVTSKGTVPEE